MPSIREIVKIGVIAVVAVAVAKQMPFTSKYL